MLARSVRLRLFSSQAPLHVLRTPCTLSSSRFITQTCSRPDTRAMTSKCEWLVILPDRPNALSKRMQVRPQHLEQAKKDAEAGFWSMAGATLDSAPTQGQDLSLNGSVMIAVAESAEQVLSKLKEDVYATGGVWDMDKVKIMPFKAAFRNAV